MQQQNNPRLARNNFDLLRLLFAGVVVLVHSYEISGFEQLKVFADLLSSALAVKAFFVVSGFLVFMSFERSKTIRSYAEKRFRRIFPAYSLVVTLCAVGLFLASTRTFSDYFLSIGWIRYLVFNLAFLNFMQPTLPGVFESNHLHAVNGALWTLKIEVTFYVAVPLLAFLIKKSSRATVIAMAYGASVSYVFLLDALQKYTDLVIPLEFSRQFPAQLSYFISGAFFYYFLPLFERHVTIFVAAAALILGIDIFLPLPILTPFALATMVIFFGLFCYAGNFGKYGDFSYGVYILHYPTIQILLTSSVFKQNAWGFFASMILLTMFGAILMWHLVEKRFISSKSAR